MQPELVLTLNTPPGMQLIRTAGMALPAELSTTEVTTMLNNATIDKLLIMKLKVMADAYIVQEQDPSYRDVPFSDRFSMLVDAQYNQRQDNRMKRLVKAASLDQPDASVMNIDYHSGRTLNRRTIQKLATCEYIMDSLNIFITGATGSGKTYLACALGMEALKQYITVKYVRLSDFLLECTVAWDEKRYDKVLQTYAKPKLLIIDEWLAMKPDPNDLHAIKELVHRRRRKSSTIFCSQILKEGWYQALGGEDTEAEAILDRITYDGYDINIEYTDPTKAVSMRKIYNRLKPID